MEDLVELAMTGKGRGPAGWVDCVIVLVDSGSFSTRRVFCVESSARPSTDVGDIPFCLRVQSAPKRP